MYALVFKICPDCQERLLVLVIHRTNTYLLPTNNIIPKSATVIILTLYLFTDKNTNTNHIHRHIIIMCLLTTFAVRKIAKQLYQWLFTAAKHGIMHLVYVGEIEIMFEKKYELMTTLFQRTNKWNIICETVHT